MLSVFAGNRRFVLPIALAGTAMALRLSAQPIRQARVDWLLDGSPFVARIQEQTHPDELLLTNGLISRLFRLSPNAATVDYRNLVTGETLLRAVRPEVVLTLNGHTYKVGGLEGQVEQAYLRREWLDRMTADPEAFQLVAYRTGETEPRFSWKPKRWCTNTTWPPPGKSLHFTYAHRDTALRGVRVTVHYELYDGLPVLCKWFTLVNGSRKPLLLNTFVSEILAVVEAEATVATPRQWDLPNIHVESDYEFHGSCPKTANVVVNWLPDSTYTSQVNYQLRTPCQLECRPPLGPALTIAPGDSFESFRVWELPFDSYDRERKGLALRQMYRKLAPWITENPIFMHLTSTDPAVIRHAVNQCAATGFEMIILSFGSGLNMEDTSPEYLAKMREAANYAHSRGIEIGGYSLLASRHISDEDDVVNPKTGKPGGATFGYSPCLGSQWGQSYFRKIEKFLSATGFDVLEHDGSYPGDVCASTRHPGHRGLLDSQWTQWQTITRFYKWCRGRDIYLNVPDWYFLSGSNKTGVGYREVNWSLPRQRQIVLGRQNLFDGTWEKTPSMGWTFVPLVQYHGGGAVATLEPLSEHLEAYQAHLVQNFGAGVQACYRGPRLYDSDTTKALVKRWVDWYLKYREILNSDIVHLHRADGRQLDGFLHVNPRLRQRGMLLVFNPTERPLRETWALPLYYTGLRGKASIREHDKRGEIVALDDHDRAWVSVYAPGRGFNWYVIEAVE